MATAEASDPNTDALGNTISEGVFDRSIDTLISRLRAQIEPVWRRATILKSVEWVGDAFATGASTLFPPSSQAC